MFLHKHHRFLTTFALVTGAFALSPQAGESDSDATLNTITKVVTTTFAVQDDQAATTTELFPAPSTGMLIKGGSEGQISLEEYLREFGSITGETFLYDKSTAEVLAAATAGLNHDISVTPETMYPVMQSLLIENRLALIDVRRKEPRLLKIVSVDSRSGQRLRSSARFVPEAELQAHAANQAMLITTSISVPNLNENDVSNRMRVMMVDNNLERIFAIPLTRQVVLTGPATQVIEWAALLHELDRVAAQTVKPDPTQGE